MKAAAILIVMLSQQGYWFAGQDGTIVVRWAARGELPGVDLSWELLFDGVRIASGQAPIDGADKPLTVTIKAPDVQRRARLRWTYRLLSREGKKELEKGEAILHVFPDNLSSEWARRLKGKTVVVLDKPEGLPRLLTAAKVNFTAVDNPGKVQWLKPDVLLIGPGQIGASPFAQAPIVAQAKAGASVLVLGQDKPQALAGFDLARQAAPSVLSWKEDHPLFNHLDQADRESWLARLSSEEIEIHALQLPADAPVLELAWWPRETPGEKPVPLDALIAVQSSDQGRIVFWQLPLGDWQRDPRSQIVLDNVISYFLTQPQPTLPLSQRRTVKPQEGPQVPSIAIPAGARP